MSQTQFIDYYALFQIPPTATTEDIYKSYKKLALIYHPDKYQNDQMFLKIQQGLNTLLHNRQTYDKAYHEYKNKPLDITAIQLQTRIELDLMAKQQAFDLDQFESQVIQELQAYLN